MITKNPNGWPGYMAPELLMNQIQKTYKKSIDIWSLGCVLYELFHLKSMWYKPKSETLKPPTLVVCIEITQRVNAHDHEPIDSDCPKNIEEVILDSTRACANDRPSAHDLFERSKSALSALNQRLKPEKPFKKPGLAKL